MHGENIYIEREISGVGSSSFGVLLFLIDYLIYLDASCITIHNLPPSSIFLRLRGNDFLQKDAIIIQKRRFWYMGLWAFSPQGATSPWTDCITSWK